MEPASIKVSVFEDLFKPDKPIQSSLSSVLDRIKNFDKCNISELRKLPKDQYKAAKDKLPGICFNGTFSYRNRKNLIKSSGLCILDFDDNLEIIHELKNNPYVYSAFLSPSGKGYKALVRIPNVRSDAEFKQYFLSLSEEYPQVDGSGKDIARFCFVSYDPNIYINENPQIYLKKKVLSEPQRPGGGMKIDYKIVDRFCKIIQGAVEGQRHNKILAAARLAGGYVGAGKMDYEQARKILEDEAYKLAPDQHSENIKAIQDGLDNGMKMPLSDVEKVTKEEEVELKYGKIYYTLHDVTKEIEDKWENGISQGYHLGFKTLREYYSIKMGSTTFIYGHPYSGKSQVWFEFLVNLSTQYKMQHAIFSPETGRASDIFIELIEMVAMKDFYSGHGNRMKIEERKEAQNFVDKHFIVIDPKDGILTVDDFFAYIGVIEKFYDTKIHTTTIDPWNELHHDISKYFGARDKYLEVELAKIRENARVNDRHNCIVTHTRDQELRKQKDTEIWYYPQGKFQDVADGQVWSRKGMGMISVWRPPEGYKDENGIPVLKNESWIDVQKAKPKGVGKTGLIKLFWDAKKHRYTEYVDSRFMFAGEITEEKEPIRHSYYSDELPIDYTLSQFENEKPPF